MKLTKKHVARISLFVVFLALIRCISEFFRLKYVLKSAFTIEQATPFLLGAMVAAVAALAMTILSFYEKYGLMIIAAVLAIAGLVTIKVTYSIEG